MNEPTSECTQIVNGGKTYTNAATTVKQEPDNAIASDQKREKRN